MRFSAPTEHPSLPAPRIDAGRGKRRWHGTAAWLVGLVASVCVLGASAARMPPVASAPVTASGSASGANLAQVPADASAVLFDQMDHAGTTGSNSQDFEAAYAQYDDQLADDFVVPTGAVWSIDGVDVTGIYFNGSGPAESFNVYFYADATGMPGNLVTSRMAQPYTNDASAVIAFDSPVVLPAGSYWIAVQARMDYAAGGQWAWTNRTLTSNNPAVFENPGDGLGTGCTTWAIKTGCALADGPDQLFRLHGTSALAAHTWAVTTNQDDPPPGVACNPNHECATLRDAIFSAADGDTIVFDLGAQALPATIDLANATALSITKSLIIHGPGFDKLAISAQVASRVFFMPNNAPDAPVATIDHLTIENGRIDGEPGTIGANATTAGATGGNGGDGGTASGGCIYVGTNNTLHLNFDLVTHCFALAGAGGAGGTGAAGAPGDAGANNGTSASGKPGGTGGNGGKGGSGGQAHGGAITECGTLTLDSTTISQSIANAGAGGDGGAGGAGGSGGAGGNSACTVIDHGPCLPVGPGGTGGAGGKGGNGGTGGNMGWAMGGAIYGGGAISFTNATLVNNRATTGLSLFGPAPTGGDGGARGTGGGGGAGGPGVSQGQHGVSGPAGAGGIGGGGGVAEGGGLFNWNTSSTYSLLVHTTIAYNQTSAGGGGQGMNGSSSGSAGFNAGGGIENHNNANLTLWNSIIADNQTGSVTTPAHLNNCNVQPNSNISLMNDNLSDDSSCGNPDTQGDPKFAAPQNGQYAYPWGGNGLPVLMLLPGSPAIDGAKVHSAPGSIDSGGCAVDTDERGVSRPHAAGLVPAACDLGAVEAGNDIIFIDGFDTSP